MTRADAEAKMSEYKLDGVMIGRGVFHDPYVFSDDSPWTVKTPAEKVALYIRHLELYRDTYTGGQRRFDPVKKFMKVYISGFDGASDVRAAIAETSNCNDAIDVLRRFLAQLPK